MSVIVPSSSRPNLAEALYPPAVLQHMPSLHSRDKGAIPQVFPASPSSSTNTRGNSPLPARSISTTPASKASRPSSSERQRPLPPLPKQELSSAAPVPPALQRHRSRSSRSNIVTSSSISSGILSSEAVRQRTRTLSSFLPRTNSLRSIIGVAYRQGCLSNLLSFLPWTDFLSLSQTCRMLRDLIKNEDLRNVILTRYIEGYGYCLRDSDTKISDITVTIHDIDLLLISQFTPLHVYPSHSLSTLSSLLPTFSQHQKTRKLVELTQAHSRFVLLLQSLAHSSSKPPLPEPEPESPLLSSSGQSPKHARFGTSTYGSTTAIQTVRNAPRELKFPAPLSYTGSRNVSDPYRKADTLRVPSPTASKLSTVSDPRAIHRHSPSQTSSNTTHLSTRSLPSSPYSRQMPKSSDSSNSGTKISPHPRHSSTGTLSSQGSTVRKNRMSFFGGNIPTVPPPPPSDPKDLKHFSSGWRRSLTNASTHARDASYKRHSSTTRTLSTRAQIGTTAPMDRLTTDDERYFPPPTRQFGDGDRSSSDSSFGSSSATYSSTNGSRPSTAATTNASSPYGSRESPVFTPDKLGILPAVTHPSMLSTTPHDLILATSRVRAPILRVFVPCTRLTESPESSAFGVFLSSDTMQEGSIQQCEQQLVESGLWDHMSTGDIVCNLGFVPRNASSNGTSDGEEEPGDPETSIGMSNRKRRQLSRRQRQADDCMKWLIFDGTVLTPFNPSGDRLPVEDPISLPSPWYYEHIMPSSSMLSSLSRSSLNQISTAHQRYSSHNNPTTSSSDVTTSLSIGMRMVLRQLPPPASPEEVPPMTLVTTSRRVPSPHSPGGFAIVQRWVWLARLWRGGSRMPFMQPEAGMFGGERSTVSQSYPQPQQLGMSMGIGWEGEWILEWEGTKEGKQMLLECTRTIDVEREWEFVREKSGGGRIWLRLLNPIIQSPQSYPLPNGARTQY